MYLKATVGVHRARPGTAHGQPVPPGALIHEVRVAEHLAGHTELERVDPFEDDDRHLVGWPRLRASVTGSFVAAQCQ